MPDLGSQIRHYVDDIVQPLEIEDVRPPAADDAALLATSQGRPRIGWVTVAAAAACVVVLAGLLVVDRGSDSADRVEAGLGTTVTDGTVPETTPATLPADCIWQHPSTAAFLDTLVEDGLTVGFVASYESHDESYESLFFLSAEIDGGELDGPGDVATWASNVSGYGPPIDPESGSALSIPSYLSFVPVNDLATTISSGLGSLRAPTMDTDGAVESQECLAPRPVPDLIGVDRVDAVRLLEGTGFLAAVTEVTDPVAAVGEVVRMDPAARTSLAPGSAVTVSVSMGPAPGPTTDGPSPTESEATSTVARPEVAVTYADGTVGSLEDFAGTPVVLVFFASWCAPCRQTLGATQQAVDEYGSGVAVVGVQTQETLAGQFVQEQGLEFPIVSDPEGVVLEALGGFALPAIVVLDAEGGAGPVHTGLVSIDKLRAAIDEDLPG
jgi:thiol-disulfide isomerase/thioredoxin